MPATSGAQILPFTPRTPEAARVLSDAERLAVTDGAPHLGGTVTDMAAAASARRAGSPTASTATRPGAPAVRTTRPGAPAGETRPDAEALAGPAASRPADPPGTAERERLAQALVKLEAALAEQRAAVAGWRGAIADLSSSMQSLRGSVQGYQGSLGKLNQKIAGLREQTDRLGQWADAALARGDRPAG